MTKMKPGQRKGAGVKKTNRTTVWKEKWQARQKAKAQQEQKQKLLKCAVCFVEFDAKKLKEHYTTDLHKELVEVKQHWLWEARFHKTLDEQIEKKGSDMPFVGLEYIRQYQPNEQEEHTYECRLCQGIFRPRAIFYHMLSIQHRIFYLAKHHKSMGIDKKFQVNTREQYMRLVTCTANAAQLDGRKPINIIDHVYVPNPEGETGGKKKKREGKAEDSATKGAPTGIGMDVINQALASVQEPRSSERPVPTQPGEFRSGGNPVGQGSGSSNKQEDLLELLSAFLEARSQMDPDGSMSQEGAGMNAANLEAAMTGSRSKPAAAQPILPEHNTALRRPVVGNPFTKGSQGQSFRELNIAHDAKMRATGRSEDLKSGIVGEQDLFYPDYFWCNDELYDFLGHLAVEGKEDVDYVLKVTDIFANALVRHKQRTEDLKKRIEEEKKKLEAEKKAFMSNPVVNKVLQKKELTRSRSRSLSPRATAAKRKASTDTSSGNKPLFPIGSSPVNTEPPTKAKRLMSLSFDSYRPPAPGRNKTPPRRLSDSKNKQAQGRPGNRPSFGADRNRPQGRGAANTSPRQQRLSGPQSNQSRPSDQQRPAFGQAPNRPQGPQSANTNPPQQRMQGSQFNQSGPSSMQRPGPGFSTGPSTANTNPSQQRMQGSQFSQSGPSSDQRAAFGQASNRPQGNYMGPSTANTNPSQQRMPGAQFGQSGPSSDQRQAFGQTANRPQDYFSGPSSANPQPPQRRVQGSRFSQPEPSSGPRPAFGQASNKPQGFYTGPSAADTNTSPQRMPGSQFRPSSDQRPAFGQASNRPQGPASANTNPSQQRMAGSQFNQSRPSDPRQDFGPQGPESNFQQSQSRFGPRGNVQGTGMRETISGSRPTFNQQRQPMNEQRPSLYQSRPGLGEQNPPSDQSRAQMNESRASWQEQRQPVDRSWSATADSRNPALEGFRSASKEMEPSEIESKQVNDPRLPMNKRAPQINAARRSFSESEPTFNESEPPVKESRSSWQEERPEVQMRQSVNVSKPPVKESRPSFQDRRPEMDEPRASVNESEFPVNESGQSWRDESRASGNEPTDSRPSWQEQRVPSKDQYSTQNKPRQLFSEQRQPFNEQRLSSNESRPPFNESRPSNQSRPLFNDPRQSSKPLDPRQSSNQSKPLDPRQSSNPSKPLDPRQPSNQPKPLFNEQRPALNQAKPTYGMSDRYTESDAYSKENERYTSSQYGNSGPTAGARTSYGPGTGAGRPEESDAYYKENERYPSSQYGTAGSTGGARQSYGPGAGGAVRQGESDSYYKENERYAGAQYGNTGATAGARAPYGSGARGQEESDAYYKENEKVTGSQFTNTGSTGGARPSYGPGPGPAAGRPGESDAYYKENERYAGSQYGNTGSTGGARPSYGTAAGTGRPEESDAYYKENERYTGSQYANRGAAAGAKQSYGSGAGGPEGASKDSYNYGAGYNVTYPTKYSAGSSTMGSVEPQSSQHPASMGSSYGVSQGNWSSSMPARSDTYPSRGPGAATRDSQQPYSSDQGTAAYNESWN